MKTLPAIKAGDTFSFDIALLDKTGKPLALPTGPAPAGTASQLRNSCGDLIADLVLTVSPTDPSKGTFAAASTALWPVTGTETAGPLTGDIRFTYADGTVESTESFTVTVVKGATYA